MLYAVTITNPKGEALELELAHPEKSGLLVANIEGLGPPKANINGQEIATVDGMMYSSARAESRDIVFTLAMFERDATSKYGKLDAEQARHLTYIYFPLKKKITMAFRNDSRIYYIDGYVESNDIAMFSSEEYTQISVICPDPYFYEMGGAKTVFSGIQPVFEFPFYANVTAGVRRNLLDNADFRHPANHQGKSEYDLAETWALSIDGWYLMNTYGAGRLLVKDGFVEYESNTLGGMWDRRMMQTYMYSESAPKNISTKFRYTLSMVYKSDCDWWVDFMGALHMAPDNEHRPYFVPASDSITIHSISIPEEDFRDPRWQSLAWGRVDGDGDSAEHHIQLYAMKLEQGEGQTLARFNDDGSIHYLADDQKDEEMLEFSAIWLDSTAILNYQGTVDTGIVITVHAFDAAEGVHLFNVDTQERFDVDTEKIQSITGKAFGAKDDIVISTVKGDRYCRLLRDGVYTNIIGAVSRESDWFQISSGNNGFTFSADKGADNLSVTFSYKNFYVGV